MNEHLKLNMDIISGSVLMLWSKIEQILSTPLNIQITKVSEFSDTAYRGLGPGLNSILSCLAYL